MILEDVFYVEIELTDTDNSHYEFMEKAWYALNIHTIYPEEKPGNNAFLDWARDLFWIKQMHIIVILKGVITKQTYKTIEFINEYWKERLENAKNPEERKRVDFIIAGELK